VLPLSIGKHPKEQVYLGWQNRLDGSDSRNNVFPAHDIPSTTLVHHSPHLAVGRFLSIPQALFRRT
jgi:hypothetical protein